MIPEGIRPARPRFAILLSGLALVLALVPGALLAQERAGRITSAIDESERTTLAGTRFPMARPENETGRVPAETALEGITVVLSRTLEQESALQALIAAQQDPSSPLYHQWLTPEEFGARFGAAAGEISIVEAWLKQRGFTLDGVSRSQNRITFSGTVGQIESTFGTELHYYTANGETHFAPALELSVPAALAPVIESVKNLSTFRLKPRVRNTGPRAAAEPQFTSGQTGSHFLGPGDVATIYDITPAYNGGYNGTGQKIAVVGQSAVVLADIEHFQTAAGFSVKDPTLDLVPSSGTSTIVAGDEAESDLDLEYTSTIASGATILFVYTGNSNNSGVMDALTYAVDQKLAPVISMSYGGCETGLGASAYQSLNGILAQAATQGQSVIVSAGDNGSPDCYGEAGLSTAQQQAPAVDFPASSQYVTAMGGTEFPAADVASSNSTYWKPSTGIDLVNSALSYIPEQTWNDNAVVGNTAKLSSGGGGVSVLTSRPSWQTGVPGIPSGSFRLVPDISLDSSPVNAPYLFCSSDTSVGVSGSCTNGFRDSSNKFVTAAGGTSFAAPIFASMAAILNDRLGSSGQGVLNQVLYTLAAHSTTYASAFHDTTLGGNQCNLGTTYCSTAGASDYAAGTGYDEATGLGSIDFFKLMSAWPGVTNAPVASKTTVAPATSTPLTGATDAVTITVASASSSSTATPTGTLSVSVDGVTKNSSLALTNGSASYTFSSTVTGAHTISATYSGNITYAASNGSATVTVSSPTPVSSKTTVSAARSMVDAGVADAITVTVSSGSSSSTATPTGTIVIAVDSVTQGFALSLSNGSAVYNFSSSSAGSHTISAAYSGDATYAASSGSQTVTVLAKSFTLTASNVTVAAGSSGSSTVTVTPQNGYTGTISWTVTSNPSLSNGCFALPNVLISGSNAVTGVLAVHTASSSCGAAGIVAGLGTGTQRRGSPFPAEFSAIAGLMLAALLSFCLAGKSNRFAGAMAALCLFAVMGFAASGCTGTTQSSASPQTPASTNAAKGTYTVRVVGTDTTTTSITASTTLTVTVD